MSITDRQIATVEQDGRIALPEALTKSLGVELGARYEVTVDREQIHLRPLARSTPCKTFDESSIDRLRAMLRGGPSLEDELLATRREEEARLRRKEEEWI